MKTGILSAMILSDFTLVGNKPVDVWQAGPSSGSLPHDSLGKAELGEETREPVLPVAADADLGKSPFRRDLCAFPWFAKGQSIHSEFSVWSYTESPEKKRMFIWTAYSFQSNLIAFTFPSLLQKV